MSRPISYEAKISNRNLKDFFSEEKELDEFDGVKD